MSVANKKRLSRIKGINWKKVILWTFNIVCYVITFIFTISLIVGSIKKPSNQQQSSNSVIDLTQQQKYGLVVDSTKIIVNSADFRIPVRFDLLGHLASINDVNISAYNGSTLVDDFVFDDFDSADEGVVDLSSSNDINLQISLDGFVFYDSIYNVIYPNYTHFEIIKSYQSIDFYDSLIKSYDAYFYANPNDDIFDTIGDTIPSFVSTINSGLNEAITIFYDDGLTTIGYLSAIVVAVVLGYFSLRAVMGLIRLRG